MARKPITFLRFSTMLGVVLTPVQRVLAVVAFDGAEPSWLEGEDREVARRLFGDVETIPGHCRHMVVALCGARSGKSYLSALRLLHLALTVDLSVLAPGERASALIVAPRLSLAMQTFSFVLGAAQSCREIAGFVSNVRDKSFILRRENGREVRVECLAASRGGDAIRARNYVGAVLDEFAFFRDSNWVVNDGEILRAVSPRIMKTGGGQLLIPSTAWAKIGLMYELFTENWGHPVQAITCRAPTEFINPAKSADVAKERAVNPINALNEFDTEFLDSTTQAFFSHDTIESAVDSSLSPLSLMVPDPRDNRGIRKMPPRGCEVLIGIDVGFKKDCSAIVVVYKLVDGQHVVAEVEEQRPQLGRPLVPSEVAARFAEVTQRHRCDWVMGDPVYSETMVEELARHGVRFVQAPMGRDNKTSQHMHIKMLLQSGMLKMPKHGRLLEQLKSLVAKPVSGGGLSFQSPRAATGGHGDILSALVLACSSSVGETMLPPDKPSVSREDEIREEMKSYWERDERDRFREHQEDGF